MLFVVSRANATNERMNEIVTIVRYIFFLTFLLRTSALSRAISDMLWLCSFLFSYLAGFCCCCWPCDKLNQIPHLDVSHSAAFLPNEINHKSKYILVDTDTHTHTDTARGKRISVFFFSNL